MTPATDHDGAAPPTHVLGFDLAGPANAADTAVVQATTAGDRLKVVRHGSGIDDRDLPGLLPEGGRLVIGLDAPLSYQPGGGDRSGDRELRSLLTGNGLPPGTVMAPTMTRMAYLTLRGVAVARMIRDLKPDALIVEVHPGGVMVLGGAPAGDVRRMKQSATARERLGQWLGTAGLEGLGEDLDDHTLAAGAAALGAWHWSRGTARWRFPAEPPLHPFDYCC